MDDDVLRRARWHRFIIDGRYAKALFAAAKDGGEELALVENVGFMAFGCPWRAGDKSGMAHTPKDAMRAARRALRGQTEES